MLFFSGFSLLGRRLLGAAGGAGLLIALFTGCGGGGDSSSTAPPVGGLIAPGLTPFTNSRQTTAAPCQANAHSGSRARWTVLVYINAASDLQDFSWLNAGQMAAVGSDSNVNIVVQWKQASSNPFFTLSGIQPSPGDTPSFVGTRRYFIRKHTTAEVNRIESGDTTPLDSDRLPDPTTNVVTATDPQGTSDMGDWRILRDFVQWGAATYPADHLAVVVWDHGSAALSISDNRSARTAAKKLPRRRSVSFDTNTGSQITTLQLAQALSSLGTGGTQRADLLIIDCSLEGTTEVAYEVRNVARAFVATEESPPAEGLAYDGWLAALKAGGQNPCFVGDNILNTFVNQSIYQNDTKQSQITLSLIDLTQMQSLIQALNAFGASLRNHLGDSGTLIARARDTSQEYEYTDYKDLYDFANRIRTATVPADLQTAAYNVQAALVSASGGAVLASVHGSDTAGTQARSTGLSIHFPLPGQLESEYATLAISQSGAAPNWNLFLQSQTQ